MPFGSEEPKAEDYHHLSHYDLVPSDHGAESTILVGRTEVVSALELVQPGLDVTIPGELTLSTMNIATLKDNSKKEINQFQSGKLDTDRYCTELLRRATLQDDQDAWNIMQQLLGEIVRGWIDHHPQKELVRDPGSEEIYVTQAFALFKQIIVQHQVKFTCLTDVLCYLRASLNGAILERSRAFSLPQVSPFEGLDNAKEPETTNSAKNALWELLKHYLPSAREQKLGSLLFHLGLGPKDIVIFSPQEFQDVREISRLRCFIIEQLLHQMDHLAGWRETVKEKNHATRSAEGRDGEGEELCSFGKGLISFIE